MAFFKERPEDFEVREVMDLPLQEKGEYAHYMLMKKGWGSFEAFQELARRIGIKPRLIGYGGLKDKHAVTYQYISLPADAGERLRNVKIKDMSFEFLGYGKDRITLGALQGNTFRIVVRGLDKKTTLKIDKVRNSFDTQRFGNKTLAIGRAMIQHDFVRVCKLLGIDDGGDPLRAIRRLERRPLRFYVSSYQSWMWNTVVEQLPDDVTSVPLLGYLTEFTDKRTEKLYLALMKKENITLDNFLLKPIPELSSEGGDRSMFFIIKDFSSQWEWDELHPKKHKCILTFSLPKGCYATLVVKQLFPGVKDKSL